MITVTRTIQRPDASVPFFPLTQSIRDYIDDTYVKTGDCTGLVFSVVNPLTVEVTNQWMNQEALDEFKADPVIQAFIAERTAYNATYGITETVTQS